MKSAEECEGPGKAELPPRVPTSMSCLPSRGMPVLMINGKSDHCAIQRWHRAQSKHSNHLAEDSAKLWAKVDRCSEKPEHSKLPSAGNKDAEVSLDAYGNCQKSYRVLLYAIKGGRNTWPGKAHESEKPVDTSAQNFEANQIIRNFLQSQHVDQ